MPAKIFISYRRDDDASGAARVRDGLAKRFGGGALFMDVDNLVAGEKFDVKLAKALDACDVLIAIIGPRWLDLLRARVAGQETDKGDRDYVREEIAAALKRGVLVIPVRVGRDGTLAPLPRSSELPFDIRALVAHQKHDVRHETHGRDVNDLADAIVAIRRQAGASSSAALVTGSIVALLIAVYVGASRFGLSVPWQFLRKPEDRAGAITQIDVPPQTVEAPIQISESWSFSVSNWLSPLWLLVLVGIISVLAATYLAVPRIANLRKPSQKQMDAKNESQLKELEEAIEIALQPHPSDHADIAILHCEPIGDKNGYVAQIFIDKMPDYDAYIVKRVLNAGAMLNYIQQDDRADQENRFYVRKELYKILLSISASRPKTGRGSFAPPSSPTEPREHS